jgi:hypothetical protein
MEFKKKEQLERRCNVLITRLGENREDASKHEMMAKVELINTLGLIARFGNCKHLAMAKSAKSILNDSINEQSRTEAVLKLCEEIRSDINNFKYSHRATYNIGALFIVFSLGLMDPVTKSV